MRNGLELSLPAEVSVKSGLLAVLAACCNLRSQTLGVDSHMLRNAAGSSWTQITCGGFF